MAKKLDGETYKGTAISVPISEDGQVAAYVWPLRILTVQRDTGAMTMGGPTIGGDVGMEEDKQLASGLFSKYIRSS